MKLQAHTLPAGTLLYHGTGCRGFNEKSQDINCPAWLSDVPEVARTFSQWHGTQGQRPRIIQYQVMQPMQLLRVPDAATWQQIKDHIEETTGANADDTEVLADWVGQQGYDGWIIPENYPEGADIMLCHPRNLRYVKSEPLREAQTPSLEAVQKLARQIFSLNARHARDWQYEWGQCLYWTPDNCAVAGAPVMGEESEVDVPDEKLGLLVGFIHNHPDALTELSDFDREEGQKTANATGCFCAMYVIGWDEDGEGLTMAEEVFEPEIAESLATNYGMDKRRPLNEIGDTLGPSDPLDPGAPDFAKKRMQWKLAGQKKPAAAMPIHYLPDEPRAPAAPTNPRFAWKPERGKLAPLDLRFLANADVDRLIKAVRDEEAKPPHQRNEARLAHLKAQALQLMRREESRWVRRLADQLLPNL